MNESAPRARPKAGRGSITGRRVPSVTEVAHLAGVSIGTVSRVLSNSSHPVSEDTRSRVLEAASAIDFTPNALAQGLVGGRTRIIGVVVHDITDSYFNEIVRGIDDIAGRNDYLVMVVSSYRDPDKELDYVRKLRSQRCDGIIFVGGGLSGDSYLEKLDQQLRAIENQGGGVVMLAPHELRWPSIVPDSEGGIQKLIDHLVDLGHERLALFTGPSHLRTSIERAQDVKAACARGGVELDPDLVVSGGFDRDLAASALKDLMAKRRDFTAIVCLNDQMAVGCLLAARELGLRVPEDLSIAGFDDLPVTEILDPALTTVRVPMRELGRRGMTLLLERKRGQGKDHHAKLECDLVIRASTGPPARSTVGQPA